MNEPVNEIEKDRNHADPVDLKIDWGTPPQITCTVEVQCPSVPKAAKKNLQFYPLPTQMIECRKNKIKLTAEKNYPVLGEQETGKMSNKRVLIKTVDDEGKELWISDEYFIPAQQNLAFEKDCGWNLQTNFDTKLVWDSEQIPVIRRVSFDKQDANVHVKDQEEAKASWEKYKSEIASDIKVLSGVMETPTLTDEEVQKLCNEAVDFANEKANKKFARSKKKAEEFQNPFGTQGENPLLNNIDKLWECMGSVFPHYRQVDTDGLLEQIRTNFGNRKIEWVEGSLHVDNAKTNILKADVDATFNGLKKLTSPKAADKLVAKVIVSKLKKLF